MTIQNVPPQHYGDKLSNYIYLSVRGFQLNVHIWTIMKGWNKSCWIVSCAVSRSVCWLLRPLQTGPYHEDGTDHCPQCYHLYQNLSFSFQHGLLKVHCIVSTTISSTNSGIQCVLWWWGLRWQSRSFSLQRVDPQLWLPSSWSVLEQDTGPRAAMAITESVWLWVSMDEWISRVVL